MVKTGWYDGENTMVRRYNDENATLRLNRDGTMKNTRYNITIHHRTIASLRVHHQTIVFHHHAIGFSTLCYRTIVYRS